MVSLNLQLRNCGNFVRTYVLLCKCFIAAASPEARYCLFPVTSIVTLLAALQHKCETDGFCHETYHALLDAGLEPRELAHVVGVQIQPPARRTCGGARANSSAR